MSIIILTAYDWTDIEVEARAAGVTAFCSKPMFMSDLRDSLLDALGQQKAEKNEKLHGIEQMKKFVNKKILVVEDKKMAFDAGMNGHLTKPIVIDEVVNMIAENIDKDQI